MPETRDDIELINTPRGIKGFALVAAILVALFFAVHAVTDAIIANHSMQLAMFITMYIASCVYAGRYISILWIKDMPVISRAAFTVTAAVILTCVILVFFIAEEFSSDRRPYLRILVVGLPLTILFIALGVMIKFVRTNIRRQLVRANATAEQSQVELRFLQNQLSPHFLFNTLNNIYGLSLTQHEKIPGLLLKLSDLLRYSVYDAKELYVPLKNELDYINDYIDFEKIRIGDKLTLTTAFDDVSNSDIKIAPLLLIVFIENAFKHAKNSVEQKIYIDIGIAIWANSILFSVKNSSSGVTGGNSSIIKTSSGFGLENVMKRLELLYNGEYDLKTEEKGGYYSVMLQLKIK